MSEPSSKPYAEQTLVEQLRGRAAVRRKIERGDGEVDRISDVCERAATRIEHLEAERKQCIDMLNEIASDGHFDGFDESTELWRNVSSIMTRVYELGKKHGANPPT